MERKYRMIGIRHREPATRYSTPNTVAQNLRFEIRSATPRQHVMSLTCIVSVLISFAALFAAMILFA